jgi:hypothetical protein
MSWDGIERRTKPRHEEQYDLDMTWQNAFYSMRREIHAHIERNEAVERLHAGRYLALDAKIDELMMVKEQFTGAFRVVAWLGAGALSLLSFVITFWDKIVEFFFTHHKP